MVSLWLDACDIFSTSLMWMRLKNSADWGNITTYIWTSLHHRWLLTKLCTHEHYGSAFLAMHTVPSQIIYARRSFTAGGWLQKKGLGQLHQPPRRCRQWQMKSCNYRWMKPAGGAGGKQSFQVWYFDSVSREVTGLRHEFVEFIDSCWLRCPVYRCSLLHLRLLSIYSTGMTVWLIQDIFQIYHIKQSTCIAPCMVYKPL